MDERDAERERSGRLRVGGGDAFWLQVLTDRLIAAGHAGMRGWSFAIGTRAVDLNLVFRTWGTRPVGVRGPDLTMKACYPEIRLIDSKPLHLAPSEAEPGLGAGGDFLRQRPALTRQQRTDAFAARAFLELLGRSGGFQGGTFRVVGIRLP